MGDDGGLAKASCIGAVEMTSGNDNAISFSSSKYRRSRILCEIFKALDLRLGDIKGDVSGRYNDKCCVSDIESSILNSVSRWR
jgi:hypothetical protein